MYNVMDTPGLFAKGKRGKYRRTERGREIEREGQRERYRERGPAATAGLINYFGLNPKLTTVADPTFLGTEGLSFDI